MQNLTLTNYRIHKISGETVKAACFNELSGILYVIDHSDTLTVWQSHPDGWHKTSSIVLGSGLPASPIISLNFMLEKSRLSLITASGSIFTVSVQSGQLEPMADNEDGIACASWSPSQEYLICVSNSNSLIQLNDEFDLVKEIPLDDGEFEGKAQNCHISWKSDGKFFCVNYEVPGGRKCLVRDTMLNVFKSPAKSDKDEKGLVQSVSEGAKNMGELVSWMPSGGIIAGYDNRGDKGAFRVIFWQKNGLRHLEFTLPLFVKNIKELVWSVDSEVLFVDVEAQKQQRKLLLYHRANYHWYLKTLIDLDREDVILTTKQRRNKLLVIGQKGIEDIELNLDYSPGFWRTLKEQIKNPTCLHYNVDGYDLHLTDFSKAVIPPPMSQLKLTLKEPILAVALKLNFILIITESTISIYDFSKKAFIAEESNHLKTNRYWGVSLLEITPDIIFTIGRAILNIKSIISPEQHTLVNPCLQKMILDGTPIICQLDYNKLTFNGKIISQNCTSFALYDVFLLFTNNSTGMYQKLYVLNLQLNGWVEEEDLTKKLPADDSKSLCVRNIERGSRIVCCTMGRIVFQLPRGNLETVYPKTIVLAEVKDCIYSLNYLKALELCRTHKLDLNLLFDIYPQQFMDSCQAALTSISKPDYLNLFIACLKEGISEEIKYCHPAADIQNIESFFATIDNKITLICGKVSKTLRQIDREKYILSIYTCEVKKGELEGVLRQIKLSRASDVEEQKNSQAPHLKNKKKRMNSKQVLEYVCWLADPQVIYRVALLTYDLELVSMAAQFTQKDPKEYVPYLEELKAISDQTDRRSRICLDLKNYERAIEVLSEGSNDQKATAIDLIKQYGLFSKGIITFRKDPNSLREVRKLMAQHLLNKEEINEAITIFESSGMIERALQVAIDNFKVKKAKDLMEALDFKEDKLKQNIFNMIPKMLESGTDTKQLCRAYQYVGQYELAVKTSIKHDYFKKASSILRYLKPEFIANQLTDPSKLAFSLKFNELAKLKRTFQQKYTRLLAVQKEKRNATTITIVTRQADEMYSEYSASNASQSNYTVSTTTGMKKKKQKVKGILNRNVKEGSPLEEDYLVALLNQMIEKTQAVIKQSKTLIQFLIHINLMEQAKTLRDEARLTNQVMSKRIRPMKEVKYEQQHEDVLSIYPPYVPRTVDQITSFDYLF